MIFPFRSIYGFSDGSALLWESVEVRYHDKRGTVGVSAGALPSPRKGTLSQRKLLEASGDGGNHGGRTNSLGAADRINETTESYQRVRLLSRPPGLDRRADAAERK